MYPILFEFGFITIFSFWLFIAVGYVFGAHIMLALAKKTRTRLDIVTEKSGLLFFFSLSMSRLFFVIFHPDLYRSIPGIFAIWDKGLSFWGAILGLTAGIWFLGRRERESWKGIFDVLTPGILIGIAIGNIGAFLDGRNYGLPTDLPWGVAFRSATVKYNLPIHPTQLYAALYTLILGLGLISFIKKTKASSPGLTAEIGLLGFSFFKFIEEFFRGDETVKILFLRLPQIVAVLGLILGGYLLLRRATNRIQNQ